MYRIMFENYKDCWEMFEGSLEECVKNFDEIEDENVADDQEEECYIVDENGNRMSWIEIEEMGYNID